MAETDPSETENILVLTDPQNWASRSHEELYAAVHNNNDPGQAGQISSDWEKYGSELTYDAAGRLESKHDAHGDFTFGYDANDRLTSIDAPGEADDVTMIGYDESDNRTDLKNPAVNSKFTFDDVNRLKKRTDTVAGHIFETLYSYDDWDNLKRITYPSGHVADYDYDRENRLKKVMRDPDATLVAEVNDFFPWGQIAKLTYGNGIVETFGADARMRRDAFRRRSRCTNACCVAPPGPASCWPCPRPLPGSRSTHGSSW